jgi:DNA-binding NtrC family response regulator
LVGTTARKLRLVDSVSVEVVTAATTDDATELMRHDDYTVIVIDMARVGHEARPFLNWARHLVPQPSAIAVLRPDGAVPSDLLHHEAVFTVVSEPIDPKGLEQTLRSAAKVALMNTAVSKLARATTRLFTATS